MTANYILFIIEILGTIAFALSGALTAIKHKMDVFGVVILGLTTATGGGIIRDLILGINPPSMFVQPVYALTAIAVANIVFLPSVRKYLNHTHPLFNLWLLIVDSAGLAVFTVSGVRTAIRYGHGDNIFLCIFVAVITGVGGGVLRDIFAGDRPYIFVRHFYATASLIGAAASLVLFRYLDTVPAFILGSLLVFALRLAAAHYHWNLPRADD